MSLRTAATLIERALFNAINRALRVRLPPVADVAALRAAPTRGASAGGYVRSDYEPVFVAAAGVCYEWSTAATAPDDGDQVIRPNDAGATGRWIRTESTVQTGYVRAVRLYEGEQSEDEILTRLLGQWPAVVIRWESARHEPRSQISGALYRYETDFDVWAVSSNLRGGALPEAVVGSPVAGEAVVDPGVNAMIGDIKRVLAGRSGEELGQPGIAYCEIGKEEPVYRSLAERRFVYALGVRVHATVQNPDDDDVTVDSLQLQYQVDGANYGEPDEIPPT
ncbi:MAG TPA: phage protein Gp37 [Polyangiaceae bacterium]|nr:phage protein Gp37 [Polyangiaceae bacterium]